MAPGDDSLQLMYALPLHSFQQARVLELCCGSGAAAVFAVSAGALEVVAVDVNPRCCAFTTITIVLQTYVFTKQLFVNRYKQLCLS